MTRALQRARQRENRRARRAGESPPYSDATLRMLGCEPLSDALERNQRGRELVAHLQRLVDAHPDLVTGLSINWRH